MDSGASPNAKDDGSEENARWTADLLPAVESGELRLPIDKAYPFAEADAAFAHMRANAHFGKIVLSL